MSTLFETDEEISVDVKVWVERWSGADSTEHLCGFWMLGIKRFVGKRSWIFFFAFGGFSGLKFSVGLYTVPLKFKYTLRKEFCSLTQVMGAVSCLQGGKKGKERCNFKHTLICSYYITKVYFFIMLSFS